MTRNKQTNNFIFFIFLFFIFLLLFLFTNQWWQRCWSISRNNFEDQSHDISEKKMHITPIHCTVGTLYEKYHYSDFYNIHTKMLKFTGRSLNPNLSVLKMIQPLNFPPAHHFHPLFSSTSH